MAGTEFNQLYDEFMTTVTDYNLVALYTSSPTNFATYMSAFLLKAIDDFTVCDQSLSYTTATFAETLTQKNCNMLILLMKKHWLEKTIDDLKQMSLAIGDKDFRRSSEANNMKAKQDRYNMEKEEISQKLVEYGLNYSIDWSAWLSGTFYTP